MTITIKTAGPAHPRRITVTPQAAGPARRPRGVSSDHHLAMVVIGLAVAARMARDPRGHETAIMVVIAVAAVAGLRRASQARWFARLATWDKRRNASEPRTLKARQALRLSNGRIAGGRVY